MEILYLMLGWLLGVISPELSHRIRQKYEKRAVLQTLMIELRELQLHMALVAWRVRSHLHKIDQGFVTLVRPIVESYRGFEDEPGELEKMREFLSRPVEEVVAAAAAGSASRADPDKALRVVPYQVPYLATNTAALSLLPLDLQMRLWHVHDRVERFNGFTTWAMSLFERTFDPSLDPNNRSIVQQNMRSAYAQLAGVAERLVTSISAIRRSYEAS